MPGLRDLGGCVEQPQAAHSRPGEGLGGLRGAQATARRLPRRSFVPQACRTIGAGLVKGSSAPSPPANGDRLAKHVLPRRINEIVHGKRAIPADAALRLSRALGLTDMFWIITATEG